MVDSTIHRFSVLALRLFEIRKRGAGIMSFDITGPGILHRTPGFDCYYTNEFGDNEDGTGLVFYLAGTEYLKKEDVLVSSLLWRRIRAFSRSVPWKTWWQGGSLHFTTGWRGRIFLIYSTGLDLDFDERELGGRWTSCLIFAG